MSPLWAERIRIALAPAGAALLQLPARGGDAVRAHAWCPAAAAEDGMPAWQPALDALAEGIGQPPWNAGRATVILSDHFVRILVVPWDAALVRRDEQEAMVRHAFHEAYGEDAAAWVLRWQPAPLPAPCIACALDRPLLDGLGKTLSAAGLSLVSLQPRLMARFNLMRHNLAGRRDCWLVLEDAGRLGLTWFRAGSPHAYLAQSVSGDWPGELPAILERAMLLAGPGAAPAEVFVDLPPEQGRRVTLPAGWSLRHLALPEVPTPADPRAASAYAIAAGA